MAVATDAFVAAVVAAFVATLVVAFDAAWVAAAVDPAAVVSAASVAGAADEAAGALVVLGGVNVDSLAPVVPGSAAGGGVGIGLQV